MKIRFVEEFADIGKYFDMPVVIHQHAPRLTLA